MDRTDLISALEDGRVRLEAVIGSVPDEQANAPLPGSAWSLKDVTAHINYWQTSMLENVERVVRGEVPREDPGTVDEVNDRVYQANHNRPWSDVLADFRHTHQRLLDLVRDLPDDLLNGPSPFPNEPPQTLLDFIAWESVEHYAEHYGDIHA